MEKMPVLLARKQLQVIVIGILLIIIAYWLVDKPVVFWANAHDLPQYHYLLAFTRIPEIFQAVIFLAYLLLWVRFLAGKRSYRDRSILAIANSLAITAFLVVVLKFIFGRYWPSTWVDHNLSLLHDGVYGFNWFHGGPAPDSASFPSGHEARTVAPMVALGILYPRWRWVALLVSLVVAVGLIGIYYHFVSDVIAGALLGYIVATTVVSLAGLERLRVRR